MSQQNSHEDNDAYPPEYEEKMITTQATGDQLEQEQPNKIQTTLQKFNKISSIQNSAYSSTISNPYGDYFAAFV